MNIRLDYMYRDASNYKRYKDVVLANPEEMSAEDVLGAISHAAIGWRIFPDVIHFRPESIGLPTCYLSEIGFEIREDDLDLHEVLGVEATESVVTEERSVRELIDDLRDASSRGNTRAALLLVHEDLR